MSRVFPWNYDKWIPLRANKLLLTLFNARFFISRVIPYCSARLLNISILSSAKYFSSVIIHCDDNPSAEKEKNICYYGSSNKIFKLYNFLSTFREISPSNSNIYRNCYSEFNNSRHRSLPLSSSSTSLSSVLTLSRYWQDLSLHNFSNQLRSIFFIKRNVPNKAKYERNPYYPFPSHEIFIPRFFSRQFTKVKENTSSWRDLVKLCALSGARTRVGTRFN